MEALAAGPVTVAELSPATVVPAGTVVKVLEPTTVVTAESELAGPKENGFVIVAEVVMVATADELLPVAVVVQLPPQLLEPV